ncbi:MAG: hypothetical protein R3300_13910 [Candidatus Promineifilaceae bacterium]|nr:hypothetical protein [Candidatus Promineifilaceae bacterium]
MKRWIFLFLLASAVLIALAACGGQEADPTLQAATAVAQATAAPTETAAPTDTATAAPTDTPAPTATTAPTLTEEPVADDCLACHSDQEQLIAVADPVEEVVGESSGPG